MPDRTANIVPDTIILAGGKGTRLASEVPGVAKVIASVGGVPFIDHILSQLSKMGVGHVTLSLGYLADQIVRHIRESQFKNISFDFAIEEFALGTGGGIRKAFEYTKTDPVLILNGDTYSEFSLQSFLDFHREKNANVSILTSFVVNASRYGTVAMDADQKVTGFVEKKVNSSDAYVSAGVYLVSREIISGFTMDHPFSFENELLPSLCQRGLYAYEGVTKFIDMGTPESYREANEFFSQKN